MEGGGRGLLMVCEVSLFKWTQSNVLHAPCSFYLLKIYKKKKEPAISTSALISLSVFKEHMCTPAMLIVRNREKVKH